MKPSRLASIMETRGKLESYKAGQVYHAQDFKETMFMLKSGYVKRYQVGMANKKVIELIYGPGHIFPLSQLYRKLYEVEMNETSLIYVYQAMTDIEIYSVPDDDLIDELEEDPTLYYDVFYEAGLRLRSNIHRLASNALNDDYKKVAHQLYGLAEEFGNTKQLSKTKIKIKVPLSATDIAEQVNVSPQSVDAMLASLKKSGLISISGEHISILNMDMLKDIFLQ